MLIGRLNHIACNFHKNHIARPLPRFQDGSEVSATKRPRVSSVQEQEEEEEPNSSLSLSLGANKSRPFTPNTTLGMTPLSSGDSFGVGGASGGGGSNSFTVPSAASTPQVRGGGGVVL